MNVGVNYPEIMSDGILAGLFFTSLARTLGEAWLFSNRGADMLLTGYEDRNERLAE